MSVDWELKFSWEGFTRINRKDILEFLSHNGYSQTEVRRLLRDNAVKISGTKETDDGEHFILYPRLVTESELIEVGDILYVGKHRKIIFKSIPFAWYELVYYRLRDCLDQVKDIKIKGRYLFSKV